VALYSSHDDRDPYDVVAQPPENGYDVAEDQKKNLIDAIGVQLFTALEEALEKHFLSQSCQIRFNCNII